MDTPTIANVSGETLLLFTTKNYIYAFYINGTLKDRYRLNGTISSPAVASDKIYVGSKDGKLYCLTINSSGKFEVLWTFQANGKIDSSPAVSNGVVYFATNTGEGTLYAVDASNGYELWHFRLIPPQNTWWNIMSSPFIYDGKLYIGADSGYVYCFSSSGEIDFNVNLTPLNVTVNVNGKSYQVRENTALGALLKASNYTNDSYEIYFNVTLDDSWYSRYGSFFISSIMGLGTQNVNGNWIYWSIWNETSLLSVGANLYTVRDGESIYYCYGDGSSLSNCTVLLNITVQNILEEINPDNVPDDIEQVVSKYNDKFDWMTQTPTKQVTLNAIINAINQYFSTNVPSIKQQVLNDIISLINLYFQL